MKRALDLRLCGLGRIITNKLDHPLLLVLHWLLMCGLVIRRCLALCIFVCGGGNNETKVAHPIWCGDDTLKAVFIFFLNKGGGYIAAQKSVMLHHRR